MSGTPVWKAVVGYERLYEVSSLGGLRNRRGLVMKQSVDKDGYNKISLSKQGDATNFYVHRLVLEAFVGPCPDGMECRHLDGNPANNKLENLCWGTHARNIRDRDDAGNTYKGVRHHRAKLEPDDVVKIRELLRLKIPERKIAALFDVDRGAIQGIKLGRSWRQVA